MKFRSVFLLIFIISNSEFSYSEYTANEIHQYCMKAENFLSQRAGTADAEIMSCLSFVDGFKYGVVVSQVVYNKDRNPTKAGVCLPSTVNTIQMVSLLNKWFREHPESRQNKAYLEMWFALKQYYPC
jgi:hypothetical protein